MPPRVSILVPVYNGGEYLRLFLDSALRQTEGDFELLACDDGSTDGSAAVVGEYARDPRVRLLRNPQNMGLNRTWHRLLGEMRGQWWCCPGADDVWDSDFLSRRLAMFGGHPELSVVHGAARIIDETGKVKSWPAYDLQCEILKSAGEIVPSEKMLRLLLEHNYIIQPTLMADAQKTRKVLGLFETDFKYAPDWYLWLQLARHGASFGFDPQPSIGYRVHGTSLSGVASLNQTRRLELRLVPLLVLVQARLSRSALARQALESLLALRVLFGGRKAWAHLRKEMDAAWQIQRPFIFFLRAAAALAAAPFWWLWQRHGARRGKFRVSGVPLTGADL